MTCTGEDVHRFNSHRGMGLVASVFNDDNLAKLQGNLGIGKWRRVVDDSLFKLQGNLGIGKWRRVVDDSLFKLQGNLGIGKWRRVVND